MTKFSKTMAIFAVLAFGLSHLPGFREFYFGILRPLGALAGIAFFISHFVAREMALMDQQLGVAPQAAREPSPSTHYTGKHALAK